MASQPWYQRFVRRAVNAYHNNSTVAAAGGGAGSGGAAGGSGSGSGTPSVPSASVLGGDFLADDLDSEQELDGLLKEV